MTKFPSQFFSGLLQKIVQIKCFLSSFKSMILQSIGIHDREHEARMKEIQSNHQNAMKSIQTQSELESAQHKAIMTRIIQQRNTFEESGKLDGNQFLSKAFFMNDYLGHILIDGYIQNIIYIYMIV